MESASPLARSASTKLSMSVGRSLSSVIAPNGARSRCLRDRLAYSSLVLCLRSDAASVVARQYASQSATVLVESLGGAPPSMRSDAWRSLARTSARVAP